MTDYDKPHRPDFSWPFGRPDEILPDLNVLQEDIRDERDPQELGERMLKYAAQAREINPDLKLSEIIGDGREIGTPEDLKRDNGPKPVHDKNSLEFLERSQRYFKGTRPDYMIPPPEALEPFDGEPVPGDIPPPDDGPWVGEVDP